MSADMESEGQADSSVPGRSGAFDALRRAVYEDPALQARLFGLADAREFIAAVARLSASLGHKLSVEPIRAAMGERGVEGHAGATSPGGPAAWIPFSVPTEAGALEVEWGYMGEIRFTEPFCHDTLQKLKGRPFNRLFRHRSGPGLLQERFRTHPGLPLAGLVFHMSRCGSTLVSQWLAALPDSVMLSEPEQVDSLLAWPGAEADAGNLRAMFSALGQPRRPADRRVFLKTDCWHMAHIGRLLEAFPNTPWIFLYRDPVEVLVSLQRMPGRQLVPGALTAHGFHPPAELGYDPLKHGAWVLSRILAQALQALGAHGNGLLIHYDELPGALETRLAPHLGVDLADLDREPLDEAAMRDSKGPQGAFRPDGAGKRAAADGKILELAARWLDRPYRALERARKG